MSDKVTLTNDQFGELVQQFVELQVDNMDTKTMAEWITDELIYQYGKLSDSELQERVDCYNEELFEELVDNVTSESYVDSLLTSGTDYPPLVDTEATHDSEGC